MMDYQTNQTSQSVTTFTEKGKSFLEKAAKQNDRGIYQLALEEFRRAYNHALLLSSHPEVQRLCLYNLATCYIEAEDYEKAINVFLSLLDTTIPSDASNPSKADIFYHLGYAYDRIEDKDKALKYYQYAHMDYRMIATDFSPMLCKTLVNLAEVYQARNNLSEAVDLFADAAKKYLQENYYELGCKTLLKKVDIQIKVNNFTACETVLDDCIESAEKIKDNYKKSVLFHEIGQKCARISQFEKSVQCLEKSYQACPHDERKHLGRVLQDLGAIHNKLGYFNEAVPHHIESIAVNGKLGNRSAQGQCFCNLAFAQTQLKNYESAQENYQHALQAFKDTDDRNGEWQVCEGLGGIAVLKKDWSKAIYFYQQSILSQAKLLNGEPTVQLRLLDRLTDAVRMQLKHSCSNLRGSLRSPSRRGQRPSSSHHFDRKENSPDGSRFPAIQSITEMDRPVSGGSFYPEPPPPSRPKPIESVGLVEDNPLRRALNRGRRGFHNIDGRPYLQVARGLSSFNELSVQNLNLDLYDENATSPSFHPEDDTAPHTLLYAGRVYNVSPKSFKEVSHDLQSMSHVTRNWKENGAGDPPQQQAAGSANEVRFEEPASDFIPRPQSAVPRKKKKKDSLWNRGSTEMGAEKNVMEGLSSPSEEEIEGTNYAGHYKKQLDNMDQTKNRDSSSSSSSSSGDDSPKVGDLNSSKPTRTPPEPPVKPPRKKVSSLSQNRGDYPYSSPASTPPGPEQPGESSRTEVDAPPPSKSPFHDVEVFSNASSSSSSIHPLYEGSHRSSSSSSENKKRIVGDDELSSDESSIGERRKRSKFCSVM